MSHQKPHLTIVFLATLVAGMYLLPQLELEQYLCDDVASVTEIPEWSELLEEEESTDPAESLLYLLNLLAEPENKTNRLDLRAYVEALQTYAEEN